MYFNSVLEEHPMIYSSDRIDPMDKAGAYAAQEHGRMIIERLEGSMTNVIGLPMEEVALVLAQEFEIFPSKK